MMRTEPGLDSDMIHVSLTEKVEELPGSVSTDDDHAWAACVAKCLGSGRMG